MQKKLDNYKLKLYTFIVELVCSLIGFIYLSRTIPWSMIFNSSLPSGGDNPAHPVLIKSLSEAFFGHGHIIHYSYKFWNGFELFQFYFPLPYFVAALLGEIMHPNIAFKFVSIAGVVFLPISFYFAARVLGMGRIVAILHGLLCSSFLYTGSHVMWGGNFSSNLAGMFANSWGVAFFVPALALLIQSVRNQKFSVTLIVFGVLCGLSHFYTFLMLGISFFLLLLINIFQTLKTRKIRATVFLPYLNGFLIVLLISWWMLPLFYYKPWSSEFGTDWGIKLLHTFTSSEKVFFLISFCIVFISTLFIKSRTLYSVFLILFSLVYILLFYFNDLFFKSTIFLNIRIWPTLYLSGYLMIGNAFHLIYKHFPIPVFAIALPTLFFIAPNASEVNKSESWMKWNYKTSAETLGSKEMRIALDIINSQPASRITYESGDHLNNLLGTVRFPELIPYLTHHELVLGGIVNSAPYAGIGYFLHCLSSDSCAGWPSGSIVPEKDYARAISFMKELGVQYHFSFTKQSFDFFSSHPDIEVVYKGRDVNLLKLKEQAKLVEVYNQQLPVYCDKRWRTTLLALPRWDDYLASAMIFTSECNKNLNYIDRIALFNDMVRRWETSDDRVFDRGWKHQARKRYSGYLFSFQKKFSLDAILNNQIEYYIADKNFDRMELVAANQAGKSEAAIPLLRDNPGFANIHLDGAGYDAYWGEKKLELGKRQLIEFKETKVGEYSAPFAFIRLVANKTSFPVMRLSDSTDRDIRSGLPGPDRVELSKKITENCDVSLEKSFHKMVLKTNCPNMPHIIKYSYFPKWQAEVDIFPASNGFMSLTPKSEITVLEHKYLWIDWLGVILSAVSLVVLLVYLFIVMTSRSYSKSLQR